MREQTLYPLTHAVSEDDEADLIAQAWGDPDAFAALYQRYVDAVYRYCYSRTGNRADAEDLTAQTFCDVWKGLSHYSHRGTFRAWIFTIAHRRVADHFRSRACDLTHTSFPLDELRDGATAGGPLGKVIHDESLRKLAGLVAGLDVERQELLSLRYAADLTYREIGEVVGKSTAAVKMAVRRTLKALRTAWGRQDG